MDKMSKGQCIIYLKRIASAYYLTPLDWAQWHWWAKQQSGWSGVYSKGQVKKVPKLLDNLQSRMMEVWYVPCQPTFRPLGCFNPKDGGDPRYDTVKWHVAKFLSVFWVSTLQSRYLFPNSISPGNITFSDQ